MGPGGRLRPAARTHRNVARPEGPRPTGYMLPHAGEPFGGLGGSSTGVLGEPSDADLDPLGRLDSDGAEGTHPRDESMSHEDVATLPAAPSGLSDFDLDDESAPRPGQFAPPAEGHRFDGSGNPSERDGRPVGQPRERRDARHGGVGQQAAGDRPDMGRMAADPSDRQERGPRPERPVRHERSEPNERLDRGDRAAPVCTAPQLRRFIKSRAYVPMHELRRRFAIGGGDDDVTGVDLASGRIYVGLPAQEGHLLGDLLRGGEIGFELSMDPQTPVVVGVYAMRPVPRP